MADRFEARKAELMAYCHLDDLGSGDLVLLEKIYRGAVARMAQAGVKRPAAGTDREAMYDLLVDAIVLDNWDNRGTQTTVSLPENRSFRLSLNQMKRTEPVSKMDTGTGV